MTSVAKVERHAVTAWPSAHTEQAGGWLLRHTPGVTKRRNNSALPPAPDTRPEETIDAVEAFYAGRDLPVTVQISPAGQHTALDAALAARGYRHEAPTLVLTAPAAEVVSRAPAGPAVEITAGLTPGWRDAYANLAVSDLVLARMRLPTGYASVTVDGRTAALGLFVAGDGLTGVYCMATEPRFRRRGFAAAILRAGAEWSVTHRADLMYLQVEADNEGARRLYGKAGFTHSHGYHYRVSASRTVPL
ncbi:GNAT family N-acetyltransferase [Actinoplanes sp. NEAU-A12]|uniref:GNAT family N-acetyltransferase n=1 Tax=Actinoplanes sandaracinus TaxID=3045177 RepID=A0ABT6WRQ9_9ACTN|nr:GNAT family N-acetyltransferase [Actinoplanes sandaracinus]MDI6102366.1 GNAT family N-acetyltransferase [Actinoplanes sandaracinus]